ncbi:MAG TPA: rhodanese [Elusimicrobia bacterium]|nr:rhodanese [Elusimicrobiota bacterium]HBT60719.1 rhodanese [Elusimicrobiota bacterium]
MDVMRTLREKMHMGASFGISMDAAEYFRTKLFFETTPYELKPRLEKNEVLVLDVRDRESFAKEHIPGAWNIPLEELSRNFSALPREKTVVTCCWDLTCQLAPRAAIELAQKGFKVQELIGGIEGWKNKGFPIEPK